MTLGRAITFAFVLQKIPAGCYVTQRWIGPDWSWGHRLGQEADTMMQVEDDSSPQVLGRRMGRVD